eukprot:SAG11_NODE_4475_length_1881_cov_7.488777_1_plen_90_part_00
MYRYAYTGTLYRYGCTGTHVQVYKYEIQVRMYRYTGTRYKGRYPNLVLVVVPNLHRDSVLGTTISIALRTHATRVHCEELISSQSPYIG